MVLLSLLTTTIMAMVTAGCFLDGNIGLGTLGVASTLTWLGIYLNEVRG